MLAGLKEAEELFNWLAFASNMLAEPVCPDS